MPAIWNNSRKVIFSRDEVAKFRAHWPACELRDRAYWFEFDKYEDLIDTDVPQHDDGTAARVLSEDAAAFLFNDELPEWLD